ncbi:MAG: SDR family NAD(P)-dependent oxidoreductase [Actinomycetota bacterium]|jgi:NAD(P)-dependent dehydrogenase (short-subunit alcohol dehydrogenase family)
MRELRGKVAVVTGAGAGIGRATALALAPEGTAVAVCDLDVGAAKETADLVERAGGRASVHQADVSSEDEMRGLVDGVLSEHGVVDIVVNNAGIIGPTVKTADLPLDRFHKVMDVNFWGVVHGSMFFVPHLVTRPQANLVNVASNAGILAYSRMAAYNSSKFAVRGFTETLRMELQSTPVRVTVVCPGMTGTSILLNSPVIDEAEKRAMHERLTKTWTNKPEKVAAAIVSAIRRDKPRALVGPDTAALDAIVRLLPAAHSRLLAKPVDLLFRTALGQKA